MALVVFAITLFVSAFILFLVQPMIGKLILPRLGGTPQVWNTCMVFFQMVLLFGYFYTHAVSTKLPLRRQLMVHSVLLFIPFLILLPWGPFNVEGWVPTLGANPLFSTLTLLFTIVGIPFFVVSNSAPLLQRWFGYTGHPAAKDPYFLYGASNIGSLMALLLYPFLIEPLMGLRPQAWLWTVSYGILVVAVLVCVAMVWSSAEARKPVVKLAPDAGPPLEGAPVPPPTETAPGSATTAPSATNVTASPPKPTSPIKKGLPPKKHHGGTGGDSAPDVSIKEGEVDTWRRLRWIGLAAVPTSLMLGVTTHITTDLSPIPLFWLVPLTLYLLSFIFVFAKWPFPWVEQAHPIMLYVQPAMLCVMIFMDFFGTGAQDAGSMWTVISLNVLGFFVTALVCHGELAKDRPSTKHLTEFYLLMSFGGMLGGMFNGIVAPVIFIYVVEFAVAIVCACLLRPVMKESGWIDDLLANFFNKPSGAPVHARPVKGQAGKAAPKPAPAAAATEEASLTPILDWALPAALLGLLFLLVFAIAPPHGTREKGAFATRMFMGFGIPLIIAAFFYARPLRFGLAIAAVFIVHSIYAGRSDNSMYSDRSYFGIIRVKVGQMGASDAGTRDPIAFMQLIHGHINHGMNILKPDKESEWFDKDSDFSRLATTYYHRYSPVGVGMERFNWFRGPLNTYLSDTRMPASIAAFGSLSAGSIGSANLPIGILATLWSEPPFATIGLGTGTMASYGRAYQHVHFYEIDNHIRRLSLPLGRNDYYYTYHDKSEQGFKQLPVEPAFTAANYLQKKEKVKTYFTYLKDSIRRGCEMHVYMGDARLRMALPYSNFHADPGRAGGPENFYHLMVVDAFSSDAIPAHLLTKEAFEMYFKHIAPEGVLAVHTSNRYVNLPLVVAAVSKDLGLAWLRGHTAETKDLGRYTSEWVMVCRKPKDGSDPPYFRKLYEYEPSNKGERYWNVTTADDRYLWTDDHHNLIDVLGKRDE